MENVNHKTVFVLDHGPEMKESSKQNIDLDVLMKTRAPGLIPLASVSKSLWTACIESLCEYCRIVWDIFPGEKFLRFIGCDNAAVVLNEWKTHQQTMEHLMEALAMLGPPSKHSDTLLKSGIELAVRSLSEATISQSEAIEAIGDDAASKIINCGRVICITQVKSKSTISMIENTAVEMMNRCNELAATNKEFLPITAVEIVVVHVKPFGTSFEIAEKSMSHINNAVSSEVINVKSTRHGIAIANRMLNLVQRHYDLSVTSVSGIPMKEEQHANSSANYDVLLLHPRLPGTIDKDAGSSIVSNEGGPTATMMLKWDSPKINPNEIYYCQAAVRVSPVDVNSRPSLCLTNFLLSGRSVLLEKWSKEVSTASKVTTHIITCHRSDIFLHALTRDRPAFEDPPSISEGSGGKVTDYRINDFVELIKDVQLFPCGENNDDTNHLKPVEAKLDRLTKHWPLVFSQTVIFNMTKLLEPLLSIMQQEELSKDDIMQCQKVIYQMIKYERENIQLPLLPQSGRNKKDEQYKLMWTELEQFLRLHSLTSVDHKQILTTLLQCLNKTDDNSDIFESPESPPPMKKAKEEEEEVNVQKTGVSLSEMWWKRVDAQQQRHHVEFYARLMGSSSIAQLYPHIMSDVTTPPEREQPERRHGGHFHGNQRSLTPNGRSTPTGRLTPSGGQSNKKMKKNKNYT